MLWGHSMADIKSPNNVIAAVVLSFKHRGSLTRPFMKWLYLGEKILDKVSIDTIINAKTIE